MSEGFDLEQALRDWRGPDVPQALITRIVRDVPQMTQEARRDALPASGSAASDISANFTPRGPYRFALGGLAAVAVTIGAVIGICQTMPSQDRPQHGAAMAAARLPIPVPVQYPRTASPDLVPAAPGPRTKSRNNPAPARRSAPKGPEPVELAQTAPTPIQEPVVSQRDTIADPTIKPNSPSNVLVGPPDDEGQRDGNMSTIGDGPRVQTGGLGYDGGLP